MTNLYRVSNQAPTALTSGCAATGNITVVSNVGLPTARFPYKLLIDWGSFTAGATQEAVYVTGVPTGSGGAWTLPCIRGADGTGASTHNAGAPVEIGVTGEDYSGVKWIDATSYPYGADPVDGADSTSALNSAASAAYGSNIASGTLSQGLYIPSGLYVTSAPVVIPPGVPVMTDFSEEVTTYVDGYWGTVIQPSASWAATTVGSNTYYGVITMLGQTVPSPNYATASVEQKINGLYIDCHLVPGGTTMNGVQMYGNVQRAHLWRVCVSHCPGNCFDMVNDVSGNGPDAPRFERCTARNGAAIGFNHIKISDASYFDCLAESCAGDGFHVQNASNGLLMGCRSEHNGSAGVGNGFTYICTQDVTGSGGFKMVGCSTDRNEGFGLAISSNDSTSVPVTVTGCNFRRDGRNSNSGGGGLAGIYVTGFPGATGAGTGPGVLQLAGVNVFPGVDDSGAGTTSPQYGLKIASNAGGYVLAPGCYFQGNTAPVSDDGSSQYVDLSASMQASGTTSAPTLGLPFTAGGALTLWPTGDTTGTADTLKLQNAIALLGGGTGRIVLAPGVFYLKTTSSLTSGQHLAGSGRWATTVNWVGTGDCFRVVDATTYSTRTVFGGSITGMTIDGASAGAGSDAIHMGDIPQWEIDVTVRNFSATGSIGVFFDNHNYWTEQLKGHIFVRNCATGVYFTCTGATTSTGSFDRMTLDIFLVQNASQNSVIFDNGTVGTGRLGIYGNINAGGTSYAVLQLINHTPAGHTLSYSGLGSVQFGPIELYVDVECDSTGTAPQTIFFGSANNVLVGHGSLNFGNGGTAFAASNNAGNFQFQGPVTGDSTLQGMDWYGSSLQTITANGQTFTSGLGSVLRTTGASAYTGLIVAAGIFDGQMLSILNQGSNALTMAASGTSKVANGVSCVVPALAGVSLVWDASTSLWYQTGVG